MSETLAREFAQAMATKDHGALRALLDPDVDFRAMTPARFWEASSPDGFIDAVRIWFTADDVIEDLESVETDAFADRERVGYRLRVRRDGQPNTVEQQAYFSERDGRIAWLRIMCAGYRPLA
jgi:hypothetical protein